MTHLVSDSYPRVLEGLTTATNKFFSTDPLHIVKAFAISQIKKLPNSDFSITFSIIDENNTLV